MAEISAYWSISSYFVHPRRVARRYLGQRASQLFRWRFYPQLVGYFLWTAFSDGYFNRNQKRVIFWHRRRHESRAGETSSVPLRYFNLITMMMPVVYFFHIRCNWESSYCPFIRVMPGRRRIALSLILGDVPVTNALQSDNHPSPTFFILSKMVLLAIAFGYTCKKSNLSVAPNIISIASDSASLLTTTAGRVF